MHEYQRAPGDTGSPEVQSEWCAMCLQQFQNAAPQVLQPTHVCVTLLLPATTCCSRPADGADTRHG